MARYRARCTYSKNPDLAAPGFAMWVTVEATSEHDARIKAINEVYATARRTGCPPIEQVNHVRPEEAYEVLEDA
jgi:hypothetical protein